ncbi:TerD family protein (plasmid) [Prescottella equi]|uniref:TerD family protein n=1 Tax=Rhodococcus hoagii TaxID=43767 RepID=UPI0025754FC0|nr:TerD family protein [Prescottella equi]WJJ14297.1 TerD family protein [Prescottella equi]
MPALAKGQNAPLQSDTITISVALSAPADVSALLLTEAGKVRTDADFVFYNQPTGPGVQLVTRPDGAGANLQITTSQVPADIDKVRAIITLDTPGATFGQFPAPTAHVADATGNLLYEYIIDGLSSESVVIALEAYRRQGAWKVRAVGQGYAGGFAALVTDHGITVDDAPTPAPAAVPAAPAAAPQPAYTPPPAPPQPAYTPPPAPPQPAYTPPPAPPQPAYTPPPAPPQPAYTPPPAPPQPTEVNLTKGRPVSLAKGQKVNLRKDGGVALTMVKMGLGWDPVEKRGMFGSRAIDIDLDASAVLFADDQIVDVCYYGQLRSKDGSIQHQGDNLTGAGDGDDEVINVDLTRVPPYVTTIILIVTSYKGQTFAQVQNAFCRLIDATTDSELARYTLHGGMPFTGMVMAKVFRGPDGWKLQAIGEGIQAKHPGEAGPQLPPFVHI